MIQDPKQLLMDILIIIDYQDDKEIYADEFLQLYQDRAFVDVLKSFPKEKQ